MKQEWPAQQSGTEGMDYEDEHVPPLRPASQRQLLRQLRRPPASRATSNRYRDGRRHDRSTCQPAPFR